MISRENRFIFVHIYKTAGTSIKSLLRPFADGLQPWQRTVNQGSKKIIGKRIFQFAPQPLPSHAKAIEYQALLGNSFQNFFSFSFVRNPFDWQVSLYEYARQTPNHHQHEMHINMTFEEYIEWRCNENYSLQKEFTHDATGNKLIDFIGYVENIDDDFREIAQRLGIQKDLPRLNKSKRRPANDYYTRKTQELVINTFREDFETFGYSKNLMG